MAYKGQKRTSLPQEAVSAARGSSQRGAVRRVPGRTSLDRDQEKTTNTGLSPRAHIHPMAPPFTVPAVAVTWESRTAGCLPHGPPSLERAGPCGGPGSVCPSPALQPRLRNLLCDETGSAHRASPRRWGEGLTDRTRQSRRGQLPDIFSKMNERSLSLPGKQLPLSVANQ